MTSFRGLYRSYCLWLEWGMGDWILLWNRFGGGNLCPFWEIESTSSLPLNRLLMVLLKRMPLSISSTWLTATTIFFMSLTIAGPFFNNWEHLKSIERWENATNAQIFCQRMPNRTVLIFSIMFLFRIVLTSNFWRIRGVFVIPVLCTSLTELMHVLVSKKPNNS